MPRLTECINLLDELKRIPISKLIENAKVFVKGGNYSQSTIGHYNDRFNDLRRSLALFGTEKLSEEFIAKYIEEGRLISPKLLRSSVQRKSLLNLVAAAADVSPVFINGKDSDKIQNRRFREGLIAYEDHLRRQGKSEQTIISYLQTATKFLIYLEKNEKCGVSELAAVDIRDFITELGSIWSPRSIRIVPSHLRTYLKFEGASAEAILFSSFRAPCISKPVRAMSPENIEALWGYVEGDDGDLRSKAVLALLLATGMRPSDIVKLELGDINWKNDLFSFVQSKTDETMNVSLFPVVGSAIARYMTGQRPKGTGLKHVFLTKKAPYHKLGPSACNGTMKAAFKKIGVAFVPDRLHCPRAVRRSLVSQMIAKGIPVQKAAASIGHVNETSVGLYTELDVKKMRSICLPIPAPMKGWCVLNG